MEDRARQNDRLARLKSNRQVRVGPLRVGRRDRWAMWVMRERCRTASDALRGAGWGEV